MSTQVIRKYYMREMNRGHLEREQYDRLIQQLACPRPQLRVRPMPRIQAVAQQPAIIHFCMPPFAAVSPSDTESEQMRELENEPEYHSCAAVEVDAGLSMVTNSPAHY